ncbi:hypothetical protein [Mesorhizobium sp. M0159]|uniref:hypothetical protein n=1 Tax=Mesorhizobium sp. M0159 TaxID=2956900 RepID=UPI00333B9B19
MAPTDDGPDVLSRIEASWPAIEALLESSGRNAELDKELMAYLTDLKTDNEQIRSIRWVTLALSAVFVVFLWGLVLSLVFWHHFTFFIMGENTRVALFAGSMLLSGLIIVAVLKGAFRMARERHEEAIPENLRLIAGLVASGKGAGHG